MELHHQVLAIKVLLERTLVLVHRHLERLVTKARLEVILVRRHLEAHPLDILALQLDILAHRLLPDLVTKDHLLVTPAQLVIQARKRHPVQDFPALHHSLHFPDLAVLLLQDPDIKDLVIKVDLQPVLLLSHHLVDHQENILHPKVDWEDILNHLDLAVLHIPEASRRVPPTREQVVANKDRLILEHHRLNTLARKDHQRPTLGLKELKDPHPPFLEFRDHKAHLYPILEHRDLNRLLHHKLRLDLTLVLRDPKDPLVPILVHRDLKHHLHHKPQPDPTLVHRDLKDPLALMVVKDLRVNTQVQGDLKEQAHFHKVHKELLQVFLERKEDRVRPFHSLVQQVEQLRIKDPMMDRTMEEITQPFQENLV